MTEGKAEAGDRCNDIQREKKPLDFYGHPSVQLQTSGVQCSQIYSTHLRQVITRRVILMTDTKTLLAWGSQGPTPGPRRWWLQTNTLWPDHQQSLKWRHGAILWTHHLQEDSWVSRQQLCEGRSQLDHTTAVECLLVSVTSVTPHVDSLFSDTSVTQQKNKRSVGGHTKQNTTTMFQDDTYQVLGPKSLCLTSLMTHVLPRVG